MYCSKELKFIFHICDHILEYKRKNFEDQAGLSVATRAKFYIRMRAKHCGKKVLMLGSQGFSVESEIISTKPDTL